MKPVFAFVLMFAPCIAQAQLYVGPGSALYIPAGGVLQVDSLILMPSATLALSNNKIEKSATAQWAPGHTHTTISQVYTVDTSIVFQGGVSFSYSTGNLNGNTAASLVMVKAPDASDSFQFAASSTVNTTTRIVSAVFTSPARLGKFSASNMAVPLPISLLRFDAFPDGRRVRLEWTTASERGLAGYDIERAADGAHFQGLLRKEAQRDAATGAEYIAYDASPLTGDNYYRLSARGLSGDISYYGVRKVRFAKGAFMQLSVWPIPVGDELHVQLSSEPAEGAMLTLRDMSGRSILRMACTSGSMRIPVQEVSSGMYLLQYKADNAAATIRIEKR